MCNTQSLSTWFEILGWSASPLFGPCHHLPYDTFIKQYYSCEKISRLEKNIFQALKDGNTSSVRLQGSPGCGKTTFLYHLMKEFKHNHNHKQTQYVLHIFHVNRADDTKNYRKLTRQQVLRAWEIYYEECKQSDTFKLIDDQDISVKEKLNRLMDHYKENNDRFEKRLIFIIDDVDLLDDEMTYKVVSSVKKDLELASVSKWISIRPCTYANYSKKTKRLLDEFFPTIYKMPDASLYEIMEHRIASVALGKAYKNPFSKKLCDETLFLLYEGNKRQSMSALKSILEVSLPGKIKNTHSEEFIAKYIENNAINAFLENNILPNIHEGYYRSISTYPLPYDIVQLLRYTSDKNILYGCLNEVALMRSRNNKELQHLERKYRIRELDFDFVIQKLIDSNIVRAAGKSHIELTDPGRVLQYYSERDHYNNVCRDGILEINRDDKYWDFMMTHIDYKAVVETYYTWKDAYRT